MLVPFVVDADSLTPDQAWTSTIARQCHRNLLDIWRRIGLLVHDGREFPDSSLSRAVEELPQHLRTLWQEMLKRSPPIPCRSDWSGAVTRDSAADIFSVASMALVDDTCAEAEFGLSEDQDEASVFVVKPQRLVVCRLIAANNAAIFKDAIDKSQRHIMAGEKYREIWDLRFRSLAFAPIKKVSIIDRYALDQHFDCKRQHYWLSGLERFLRLLDEDAGGPRYIALFSARTANLNGRDRERVESDLHGVLDRLPKHNVKRLKVHIVPDAGFRDDAHDRFIRFGPYVWDLGLGLKIFEGPAACHRCSASFKADSSSYEVVERALEDHPQASRFEIRG